MQDLEMDLLAPTFTTKAALDLGVHPRDLYAWRDGGLLIELSRGVFRQVDAPTATYPDLLAVTMRAPTSIVCCVSTWSSQLSSRPRHSWRDATHMPFWQRTGVLAGQLLPQLLALAQSGSWQSTRLSPSLSRWSSHTVSVGIPKQA